MWLGGWDEPFKFVAHASSLCALELLEVNRGRCEDILHSRHVLSHQCDFKLHKMIARLPSYSMLGCIPDLRRPFEASYVGLVRAQMTEKRVY